MKHKTQSKGTLSSKLKDALTDISVDIFGYEKMVSANIINRTIYLSERIKVPKERLFLRIFQTNHQIKSFLYNNDTPITAIATEDLAHFFLNNQMANTGSVKHKIAFSIKQYLKDFAVANRTEEENICIWIHVKDDKVQVRAFQNDSFVKHLSLHSLIKYFK